MKRSEQARADRRAAALTDGRYDRVVEDYCFPLTIFFGEHRSLAPDQREAWAFFQSLHASLCAEGLDKVTARVTAEDLPRAGRYRVWTDWYGHGNAGVTRCFASTICYCSTVAGHTVTEMVQFNRLTLPLMLAV